MTRVLITICARGGSKGIPGKNIRSLNGMPLLHYTIKAARAVAERLGNTDIELSSDSDEIRTVAGLAGLTTNYRRPKSLASDKAGKIDAIADVWRYAEASHGHSYDYIIDLDVTSPLRTTDDIIEALNRLKTVPAALNIFSVSPASRNPYFNMVQDAGDGRVQLVMKREKALLTRQSAPTVYDMNASFYVFTRRFFERGEVSSITDYSLPFVMDHICFDLDEPVDFTIMEVLLREGVIDFLP